MELQLIFSNSFSGRTEFEVSEGIRAWDMMLVITKGKIGCRIGDRELIVEENEILYIPANTEFYRWIVEPIDFFQFVFHTDPSSPICAQMSAGTLNIPKENIQAMAENYSLLYHLPDNRTLFLHMIERIIVEHYIHRQSEKDGAQGYSKDILYVLRYMNDHLSEKIDLDALANEVYLSHVGLIWKFKNQLHTTPSRYLIKLRLHYAKQLLLEGALRINEIASLCGYSNAYYFANAFRKEVGMTPSAFRKKHAGDHVPTKNDRKISY